MKRRFISIILAIVLLLTFAPVAFAQTIAESPTVEIFAKNTTVGNEIEFSRKDFTSRIIGDDKLQGIIITGLPDAEIGNLYVMERQLMVGEAITIDNLDNLRYTPAADSVSQASFSFLPVFSGGVSVDNVTINVAVLEEPNQPPIAQDVTLSTFRNVAITGQFNAKDPDGDPLTFRIAGKSRRGEVKLNADGSFIYTPYHNKHGRDSFTYVAVDSYGNTSAPAKVEITIARQQPKVSYHDMDGHPAHYAALQLAEAGLIVGEQVGGRHFFHPDTPVSRAEFLALAVNGLKLSEVTPTLRTGFADDEDIPAWAKPYVNLAVNARWLSGVTQEDGRRAFQPDFPITRGQASVLLNNALNLPDSDMVYAFAEDSAVPSWAAQSVTNMRENGLFDTNDVLNLDAPMTRADIAVMLHHVVTAQQTPQPQRTGVFGWLFG
ncbi:MAG: Ig-like domain-containing protein [Oscillospiraceae bacterium]|nr:Ig-like domain-containing protein [Oscillospiraceae bacterium]